MDKVIQSAGGTFWLIVFGANYAAMISAAGRLKPFNTQRIFVNPSQGALRFGLAVVILNLAPLALGIFLLNWADYPKGLNYCALLSLSLMSFFPYGFWRFYCGLAVLWEESLYGGDPAFPGSDSSSGKHTENPLSELKNYTPWQHLGGGLVYCLFPILAFCFRYLALK